VQPWASNLAKRLVRSPKVYVRDSGILHALLGISAQEQVLGHPVIGPSWEGFVIENLIAAAPPGSQAWFYRTSAGAEIDLLLDLGPRRLWAVEVKRSLSRPHPSRGFHLACGDVKADRRMVIYPGEERFHIDRWTEVAPLSAILHDGFE
jgi:predicted AAA+ superfamily ATPase